MFDSVEDEELRRALAMSMQDSEQPEVSERGADDLSVECL